MEAMVKKYQQKFRKVKEEMQRWEELQSRLISQFSNASSHHPETTGPNMIEDKKHYGILRDVDGVEQAVLRKQLESLETVMLSINMTMYLLKTSVVSALSKIALKPSVTDLGTLCQLLVDQPNILTDEVQFIFDIIFSEEIC